MAVMTAVQTSVLIHDFHRDGVVTIEDLGSKNGIFVNSVRVESQMLQHGDWVTVGETQFRFIRAET